MHEWNLDVEDLESRLYSQAHYRNANEPPLNSYPSHRDYLPPNYHPNDYLSRVHPRQQPVNAPPWFPFEEQHQQPQRILHHSSIVPNPARCLRQPALVSPPSDYYGDASQQQQREQQQRGNRWLRNCFPSAPCQSAESQPMNKRKQRANNWKRNQGDNATNESRNNWTVAQGGRGATNKKSKGSHEPARQKEKVGGGGKKSPHKVQSMEVVCLSDDSSSDCEEIVQHHPQVIVSSGEDTDEEETTTTKGPVKDEERKDLVKGEEVKPAATIENNAAPAAETTLDDDVIFIEPEPPEIINLDVTGMSETTKHDDTLPTITNQEPVVGHDQQSNDFLDNDIQLTQNNFNFALHGADLICPPTTTTTTARNESYETESSCSASDNSSTLKKNVFNEVDFDTGEKEMFAENNLFNFGNFIVSKSSPNVSKVASNAEEKSVNSDESSSESDFAETTPSRSKKKSLPQLSVIASETSGTGTSPSAQKKAAKRKSEPLNESKRRKKKNTPANSKETDAEPAESLFRTNIVYAQTPTVATGELIEEGEVEDVAKVANAKKRKSRDDEMPNNAEDNADGADQERAMTKKRRTKELSSPVRDEEEANNNSSLDSNEGALVIDEDVLVDGENQDEAVDEATDDQAEKNQTETPSASTPQSCETQRKSLADSSTDNLNQLTRRRSWFDPNFAMETALGTMSDDPSKWQIVDKDRSPISCSTPKGPRCHKCRELGHIAKRCPRDGSPVKCCLCGQAGHLVAHCPNKICNLCGVPGNFVAKYCTSCMRRRTHTCAICSMRGHSDFMCPDLWRRYHLTTREGPLIEGTTRAKPPNQQWCSGCARNGHFEFTCNSYNRPNTSSTLYVKVYREVYSQGRTRDNPPIPAPPPPPPRPSVFERLAPRAPPIASPATVIPSSINHCQSHETANVTQHVPAISKGPQCVQHQIVLARMRTTMMKLLKTGNCRAVCTQFYHDIKTVQKTIAAHTVNRLRGKTTLQKLYTHLNAYILTHYGLNEAPRHLDVLRTCFHTNGWHPMLPRAFNYLFKHVKPLRIDYQKYVAELPQAALELCATTPTAKLNQCRLIQLRDNCRAKSSFAKANAQTRHCLNEVVMQCSLENYSNQSLAKLYNVMNTMGCL